MCTVLCGADGAAESGAGAVLSLAAVALSANVRDTAGIPLNSGGHMLAGRIDGKTRAETWRWLGAPGPGG